MRVWLFDIDGTLIDSGGAGQAAYLAALRELFSVDALHGTVPFAGRTDRAIAQDLFQIYGIEDVDEAWQRFVPAYLSHLGRTLDELEGCVLPGVEQLLAELATRDDCAVGLLTGNMERGARLKLDYYGLDHHFPFGGFGCQHLDRSEVAKLAVAASQGFVSGKEPPDQDEPVERIVIGDTPHDVRCGRAIGATVIAVATGSASVDELADESPDILVETLEDRTSMARLLD